MKKIAFLLVFLFTAAGASFATSMIPKEVAIDETGNGKTLTVWVGQTLSLSLPENPSTGYRWTVEEFQPRVLEQLETIFKPNPGVGGGGTKVFGFLAKKVGTTDLTLEYQRPWAENVPPAKTFSVKLEVRKAGGPPNVNTADSPRPGPLMKLGMNLGDLAKALADLKGKELDQTSAMEISGGANKEYRGFLLLTDPTQRPRCPNEKLPVTNRSLKNMVGNLLKAYGKKAQSKELAFLQGGFCQPGFVQVTLVDTGLGLYFNIATGEPMGKLNGKL